MRIANVNSYIKRLGDGHLIYKTTLKKRRENKRSISKQKQRNTIKHKKFRTDVKQRVKIEGEEFGYKLNKNYIVN